MAQTIKLRRSGVEGAVPTTSQLDLGEVAINTFDGRVFIHKSGSGVGASPESIEHLITTNSETTGSINLIGSITSSNGYKGGKIRLDDAGSPTDVAIGTSGYDGTGIYFPSANNISLQANGGLVELSVYDGGLSSKGNFLHTGNITASGDISASAINFPGSNIDNSIYSAGGLRIQSVGFTYITSSTTTILADDGITLGPKNGSLRLSFLPEDTSQLADSILLYNTGTNTVYYTASSAIGGSSITGTPGQVLYFGDSGTPEGDTELTFGNGKFQVGDEWPGTPTATNNPWVSASYEATGSTLISEHEALITNAIYRTKRYNILGLGYHTENGGNLTGGIYGTIPVGENIQGYDLPTYGILPPPTSLTDESMGINGQLQLGNFWAETNPDGKVDVVVYGTYYSIPESPGTSMGEGGFRLFTSESMVFDDSGSLLTPKESASVEFTLADDSNDPALAIKVRSPEKRQLINALYVSQSGGRPLIGVGTTTPRSAFDVKDIKDDGSGTEFVFQTTRTSQGGQIGDKAGVINFTVDSGSYADYKTSGSVALIESEVTGIDDTGAKGDLILKASNLTKSAPVEVLRINQSTSTFTSALKTEQSLTIGANSVFITNIEDTPSGDTLQTIDSFSLDTYDGAVYDYTLVDSSNGYMRIGQFMVISDGSTVSYTDTSTRAIGGDTSEPVLSATYSGGVAVQITNGGGYVFKSLRKLI